MEETIYRMSLSENILVLVILGLWLFTVICLARKLERICNPPSIRPNYYMNNKTSLSPSTLDERYAANSTQSTAPSPSHLLRATSEPTIDASPRTTIHIHSPSETCLYNKSSISEKILSPSTIELGQSTISLNPLHPNNQRVRLEMNPYRQLPAHQALNPKRIPSIVRRSLLDLHRRALISNTSSPAFVNHSRVSRMENRTELAKNRISLTRKKYQRENAIDEDEFSKGKMCCLI
ncbi:unnamed protein product [Rotaria socialis]|uniref:Uncharacterized protein n=2 Tax=Rotaria socialis TaxID=392032 RepID=A0A820DIB3_9BILA|nr:unnamed protein product [Rotaria socialis]CAF3323067.1 unnamed protein product [Rotaria socialis]CAF3371197.1 unnamed protein product [Rotaria socialis]CAF3457250.1 unnamed protein product [Rotaria socialis]CAF3570693.1 unnamed protein product [Rotaria socialis]